MVLFVLALAHFFNMYVIYRLGKSGLDLGQAKLAGRPMIQRLDA